MWKLSRWAADKMKDFPAEGKVPIKKREVGWMRKKQKKKRGGRNRQSGWTFMFFQLYFNRIWMFIVFFFLNEIKVFRSKIHRSAECTTNEQREQLYLSCFLQLWLPTFPGWRRDHLTFTEAGGWKEAEKLQRRGICFLLIKRRQTFPLFQTCL